MDIAKLSKYMNHEIVVNSNSHGTIVWHGASNSWHIVWQPKEALLLTDEFIEKIQVNGNNLVLVV